MKVNLVLPEIIHDVSQGSWSISCIYQWIGTFWNYPERPYYLQQFSALVHCSCFNTIITVIVFWQIICK